MYVCTNFPKLPDQPQVEHDNVVLHVVTLPSWRGAIVYVCMQVYLKGSYTIF